MSFETLVQLDPAIWPLAIMAFLRVVTLFFMLPILGENVMPPQLRIAVAIVITFCLWPAIEAPIRQSGQVLQWSPVTLALATFREVVYGFAVAFSARLIIFAAEIGANMVGANMGFGTASIFSVAAGREENAFAAYQGWIALVLILGLNIHHVFIEGIGTSFRTIPIGPIADATTLARNAAAVTTSAFVLGIKLAAPLLIIQFLINITLGCLTRAVPQLNVFVLSFPLSFLLSMVVLFFGAGMYVRYMSFQGMQAEVTSFATMQKVFADGKGGP
jgi:flagellar biosynthetic protein FliR